MIDPGLTVDGLAAVLAARPLRSATAPVAVSLGSDRGPGDTTGFFESWTGNGTGGTDRYQQTPGQVDRLWILDVAGQRLVIDAASLPGATKQDRAEQTKVVDSITFEP